MKIEIGKVTNTGLDNSKYTKNKDPSMAITINIGDPQLSHPTAEQNEQVTNEKASLGTTISIKPKDKPVG